MCLPKGILSQLKTFSPRHNRYIALILKEIIAHYDTSLAGYAIFGSYARRENRLNSDLGILIILEDTPTLSRRLKEFVEEVEMKHEALAQELYKEESLCELSPYILTRKEALKLQPIYYDLVKHHLIIYDPEGLIARIIDSTRKLLERSQARMTGCSNCWDWSLEKIGIPGGIEL